MTIRLRSCLAMPLLILSAGTTFAQVATTDAGLTYSSIDCVCEGAGCAGVGS